MLFVGDDWAEDHHDVEVMDVSGRRLGKARLPEGVEGISRLHAMIGEHADPELGPEQVLVGIETDRGPWVQSLVAAGYRVHAINPRQVARFKERYSNSGAKSDAADAHVLADMVRTDAHQLRGVAGDSELSEGIKLLARAHQSMVWERTRHLLRMRSGLREYFPAALVAFPDLAAGEALELLGRAARPDLAARLTLGQVGTALKHARRRNVAERAKVIVAVLRSEQLRLAPVVETAYAATTRSLVAVITTLNTEVGNLEAELKAYFGLHPAAEVYLSQPGLGEILGSRVLGEFGDDHSRYTSPKARKNYAGTSPITIASGKRTVVSARFVRNTRLIDPLIRQAQSALNASPGARAYYDLQRARGVNHQAALRQLANRLVGILHGCLKSGTPYNETTAWPQHTSQDQPVAA